MTKKKKARPKRAYFDTYYMPTTGKKRHRKCTCSVPCEGRFQCRSRHHRGRRSTPWCFGGEGESCCACWVKEQERRRAIEERIAERIADRAFDRACARSVA